MTDGRAEPRRAGSGTELGAETSLVRGRAAWEDVPADRRRIMASNRRRDTAPELALRSKLHRSGLRFRVDARVAVEGHRPVRPDIVFPRQRVAVFLDGCFWHRCPLHGSYPRSNRSYWVPKLDRNVERDRATNAALANEGWIVVRVWEHEDVDTASARVTAAVDSRNTQGALASASAPRR